MLVHEIVFGLIITSLSSTLIGSQFGSGSTTVSAPSDTKKILCVVKKGTVVALTKEIPISVLNANDIIPLNSNVSIIGNNNGTKYSGSSWDGQWTGQKVGLNRFPVTNTNAFNLVPYNASNGSGAMKGGQSYSMVIETDLASGDDVKVAYNGNNSFTITSITDIDVYLYA